MKRLIAVLMLVCMVCAVLCACQPKENITDDDAAVIVMDELGALVSQVSDVHVHESIYNGKPCYNVYVTIGDDTTTYVVSMDGRIVHQESGGHSH